MVPQSLSLGVMCLNEKEKKNPKVSCKAEEQQQEGAGQPCKGAPVAVLPSQGLRSVPSPCSPSNLPPNTGIGGEDFQNDVQTKEDVFCRQAEAFGLALPLAWMMGLLSAKIGISGRKGSLGWILGRAWKTEWQSLARFLSLARVMAKEYLLAFEDPCFEASHSPQSLALARMLPFRMVSVMH